MNIFALLIVGLVAGFFADKVVKNTFGWVGDMLVGVAGSFVGGWIFNLLGLECWRVDRPDHRRFCRRGGFPPGSQLLQRPQIIPTICSQLIKKRMGLILPFSFFVIIPSDIIRTFLIHPKFFIANPQERQWQTDHLIDTATLHI